MNDELKQIITEVLAAVDDENVKNLFRSAFGESLEKTVTQLDDDSDYMITGDIPAMWLRDSSCQLRPILPFIRKFPQLKELVRKIIRRQLKFINIDPYANAFTIEESPELWDEDLPAQGPHVWERKYEIDSLCFPLKLIDQYWEITGDSSLFDREFYQAVRKIVNLWKVEQHHDELSEYTFIRPGTGVLANHGKGTKIGPTGMTWSGFRPSDDACQFHYLVPSNLFAVHVLDLIENILTKFPATLDDKLAQDIAQLSEEIQSGIDEYALGANPDTGKSIFAYEVDGLGQQLLMDDSNMPSLLSLPLLSNLKKADELYLNTREFVLSAANPYYYGGKFGKGVGSPHTPAGYIWPIAIAVAGLTAVEKNEKYEAIQTIVRLTSPETLSVNESVNPNEPTQRTREWFSWADSMFCELVLDYYLNLSLVD